jgi:Protein of unknown function (DUF1364)
MTMFPKSPRLENRALLDMARGKPCLLNAVSSCKTVQGYTTVAAHSNWSDLGGKGAHRKADDHYSVWSCSDCHYWLDQSSAPKAEKRRVWLAGHIRQIAAWDHIVKNKVGSKRDIDAAKWALLHSIKRI